MAGKYTGRIHNMKLFRTAVGQGHTEQTELVVLGRILKTAGQHLPGQRISLAALISHKQRVALCYGF